jgi:hypothetical protein
MATKIPLVTITTTEAGFLIKCEHCPLFHTMRASRDLADLAARNHQVSHTSGRSA